MIARETDWNERLQNYLATVARNSFQPGEFDCALFTAGAVEAMTGVNLSTQFGKYKTINGGIKKLAKAGYTDQVDFVAKHFDEIAPAELVVGDIAVVDGDINNALGIVQGPAIYVTRPTGGLGLVPLLNATRGFRVPFRETE